MAASALATARTLVELRRYAEAERAIRTHLAAQPHDAEALRLLAGALREQGRHRAALEACLASNGIEPHHTGGLVLLADLHLHLGEQDLALAVATRAVRGAPHNWGTFYTRAAVQLGPPNPEPAGALSDSLKAVQLAPNEPHTHNMLGMSYAALGQPDRARAAYEASLALDPTNVWAMNNLALLRMRRGRLSGASALLRSGLALSPQQDGLHKNYDVVLVRLLMRLWWLSTLLGITETVLLGGSAPAQLRAGIGAFGLFGIGVIAFRWKRRLPGGSYAILRGLWGRSLGPTQVLMALWALTGVCTVASGFAPVPVARPAGAVLVTVAVGIALSGVRVNRRRGVAD